MLQMEFLIKEMETTGQEAKQRERKKEALFIPRYTTDYTTTYLTVHFWKLVRILQTFADTSDSFFQMQQMQCKIILFDSCFIQRELFYFEIK